MTRRRWIAVSAAACGVFGSYDAAASSSPGDKLKIGFIGVGNYGRENLTRLASEEVTALCDVDGRYLAQARADYPRAKTYRDFREMIAKGGLDAVVISTADHTHSVAALLAIEAGLHVYCEKPLAHTIGECRELAKAAGAAKVATQTGIQHHSAAGYRQAVELLKGGSLGKVREIHAWTDRPLWPQGQSRPTETPPAPAHLDWDLWLGPAPKRPYHSAYHPIDWRGWWDFGSGAIGDVGPHLLDPVFEGLDLPAPLSVEADSEGGAEESAPTASTVRYTFPNSLTLTWHDGGRKPAPEISGAREPPGNGVIVIFEHAKLFIPERGGAPRILRSERERPKLAPTPAVDHRHQWLAACRGEAQCSADFSYGARLTEICLLGAVALRAGERIEWDSDKMRVTSPESANRYVAVERRAGW
jgi:predicted dehydrogenase